MTKPKTGKSSVKKVRKPRAKVAKITINEKDYLEPLNDDTFLDEDLGNRPSIYATIFALIALGLLIGFSTYYSLLAV